jgi:hypothetical protein
VLSCKDQAVVLGTPHPFCRDFLQARLLDKLLSWFSRQMDVAVTIAFEVPSAHSDEGDEENTSTGA